jgi:hypothetical protein
LAPADLQIVFIGIFTIFTEGGLDVRGTTESCRCLLELDDVVPPLRFLLATRVALDMVENWIPKMKK